MNMSTRLKAVVSGMFVVFLTLSFMRSTLNASLGDYTFTQETELGLDGAGEEKQTDMTKVLFPVPPLSAIQIALMKYNGLDTSKVATMTELRKDAQIVPLILHFMSVLDDDWPFRIYHSRENAKLFQGRQLQKFIDTGKLVLVQLNIELASHNAVNHYLSHRALWDNLAPAKHVLLFQRDSILCSRSDARVEDFFGYDYVGAPVHERFHENLDDKLMNGGLSLRNRETMLAVIESAVPFESPDNDLPFEDQWFVRGIRDRRGNLPSRELAMAFSVESVYYPTPLGIHQAQRYLDQPDEAQHIHALMYDWCPEMHLLYGKTGPESFVCDPENEKHYDEAACEAEKQEAESIL